jgi:hypothetical protein
MWLAASAHLACLARETPRQQLQPPKAILLNDDKAIGAFHRLGRDLNWRPDINPEMIDDFLQGSSD